MKRYKSQFPPLENFNLSEQEFKYFQELQKEIDVAYNAYNAIESNIVSASINEYVAYSKLVDKYSDAIHQVVIRQKIALATN